MNAEMFDGPEMSILQYFKQWQKFIDNKYNNSRATGLSSELVQVLLQSLEFTGTGWKTPLSDTVFSSRRKARVYIKSFMNDKNWFVADINVQPEAPVKHMDITFNFDDWDKINDQP